MKQRTTKEVVNSSRSSSSSSSSSGCNGITYGNSKNIVVSAASGGGNGSSSRPKGVTFINIDTGKNELLFNNSSMFQLKESGEVRVKARAEAMCKGCYCYYC